MLILTWALQVLILTAGIHLFLRFVRTTRGNRMIRGLLVTVLGGVVGLWGLSQLLDLEELRHLLEISTGFIVVTLAIAQACNDWADLVPGRSAVDGPPPVQ